MKLKLRKKYADKTIFLDVLYIDKSIYGMTINFAKDTGYCLNDGDDVETHLNKDYIVTKTKALMIEGVTEQKLYFLKPVPIVGGWTYYYLDDLIRVSAMTFKDLKNESSIVD